MHINFIANNNKSIDNYCRMHLIVALKRSNNARRQQKKALCRSVGKYPTNICTCNMLLKGKADVITYQTNYVTTM